MCLCAGFGDGAEADEFHCPRTGHPARTLSPASVCRTSSLRSTKRSPIILATQPRIEHSKINATRRDRYRTPDRHERCAYHYWCGRCSATARLAWRRATAAAVHPQWWWSGWSKILLPPLLLLLFVVVNAELSIMFACFVVCVSVFVCVCVLCEGKVQFGAVYLGHSCMKEL